MFSSEPIDRMKGSQIRAWGRSHSVARLGLMVPECATRCERTPAIEDNANTTAIKDDGALAFL